MGAPRGFARLTPSDARATAQNGAHTRWAKAATEAERKAAVAPALAGQRKRWARLADPEGRLTGEDLERAIESARQAHYARMRLASARARRARKEGRTAA